MKSAYTLVFSLLAIPFFLAGCKQAADEQETNSAAVDKAATVPAAEQEANIKAARAGLTLEDNRLVEAQEFCPVMPDN